MYTLAHGFYEVKEKNEKDELRNGYIKYNITVSYGHRGGIFRNIMP